jgi:polyisoprenoid-binding protein YceI
MKPFRSFVPPLAAMLIAASGGAAAQGVLIDKSEIRFVSKQMGANVEGPLPALEGERRFPAQRSREIEGQPRDRAREHRSRERSVRSRDAARRLVRYREVPARDFTSTAIRSVGGERYEIAGTLALKASQRISSFPLRCARTPPATPWPRVSSR